MVSNTNIIKNLSFHGFCVLKEIQFLVVLFPRLKQLETGMNKQEFLNIVQFLLEKLRKIFDDYSINHVDRTLCLWW